MHIIKHWIKSAQASRQAFSWLTLCTILAFPVSLVISLAENDAAAHFERLFIKYPALTLASLPGFKEFPWTFLIHLEKKSVSDVSLRTCLVYKMSCDSAALRNCTAASSREVHLRTQIQFSEIPSAGTCSSLLHMNRLPWISNCIPP